MSVLPWLQQDWADLQTRRGRLPHALLFSGPAGMGKRDFAQQLAASLLCVAPGADGLACEQCVGCRLRQAGNHPDLFYLVPASDEETSESPASEVSETSDKAEKAKSKQIVIEQIRQLQSALTLKGHQSACRVVVIDPVEAMNTHTANALLKLLEEPPFGVQFLLISAQAWRILPTILSRSQRVNLRQPQKEEALAWLKTQGVEAPEMLAVVGGQPLEAALRVEQGAQVWLRTVVEDLQVHAHQSPLQVAERWEKWLKSKEMSQTNFALPQLTDWVLRWLYDLSVLCLGGTVRYFPNQNDNLRNLAQRADSEALLNCYNDVARMRRVAQHPLNTRLFLEDMLLRYARALKD